MRRLLVPRLRAARPLAALATLLLAGLELAPAALAQASATPLIDEVRSIGRGAEPVERSFEIAAAGSYEIVLRDLATPAALQGLRLAVTRGSQVVATLDAAGTRRFDATAGTHVVRVVPSPTAAAGSGSFGVTISSAATNARVLDFAGVGSLPPPLVPETQRIVDTEFTVAASGSYQVSLTDFVLPESLTRLTLAITREGGATLAARLDAAGSANFNADPGVYRLLAIAESNATTAGGLFGVRVVAQSSGAPIFARAYPVGRTQLVGSATLGAGSHTLTFRDLAFPAALAQRAATVSRDALRLTDATIASGGTATQASFTAVAGTHEVYAYARAAATPGTGNYEIELRPAGGAALVAAVRSAAAGTDPIPTFTFPVDVVTAGSYQIRLSDFEFPVALGQVALAAWQSGASPGTLAAPGTLNATLAAGRAYLLVSARPASGGSGLLGVEVAASTAGAAPLLQTTQAVGALFTVRRIDIATAGRYDVTVRDLGFPANFAELAGVVTRGATRVGSIFGGGTFSFEATVGSYAVSFVAQPSATAQAGTYALTLAATPPAPTVTLSASQSSVTQGTSVDLTWSSQNATSCTATGGWSGTRGTSGTERSAALNAATTFTLECSGAGGRTSASASVAVTAPNAGGGGGGSADALLLVLLALALTIIGAAREALPATRR